MIHDGQFFLPVPGQRVALHVHETVGCVGVVVQLTGRSKIEIAVIGGAVEIELIAFQIKNVVIIQRILDRITFRDRCCRFKHLNHGRLDTVVILRQ